MTNTATTATPNARQIARMALMSDADLAAFVANKDFWMSTPEKQVRTDRHAAMCAAELVRRQVER